MFELKRQSLQQATKYCIVGRKKAAALAKNMTSNVGRLKRAKTGNTVT